MITFAQLEEQKADILKTIDGWPEARLRFRPAPGAWSATEIFDHLAKTEVAIFAVARRGLDAPHGIGLRDRLGERFLDRIFRSERRVKVPSSAKVVLPAADADFATVLVSWDACRAELASLLASTSVEQMKVGVFRHPVAGWMSLLQVMNFFSVHMIHHTFQLARLKKASDSLYT